MNEDVIVGGAGADTLAGYVASNKWSDYDRDVFRYSSLSESGVTKATRDVIWGDFKDGGDGFDKIDLSKIDASSQLLLDQAFTFIGTKAFSPGLIGEVRYKHGEGDKYVVQVNADADKDPEMTFVVHSQNGIHAGDFIL
jgi:serralysin